MLCSFLLYNKVNQLYAYIYPHIPSLLSLPPALPSLSHPSRWSQSTELISLCYAAASHQLSILHLVVYICQCYSLSTSQPLLPALCPQVHSQHCHLYSCPTTRFISTIFLDSIYMRQHTVFVFLFLNYFTLYDRLQIHPPHYKQFRSLLWLGNIPLYTCATSLSIHLSMDIQFVSIFWLLYIVMQ